MSKVQENAGPQEILEKRWKDGASEKERENRRVDRSLCFLYDEFHWALSSAVRAFGLHPKGRPFESDSAHHVQITGSKHVACGTADCPCSPPTPLRFFLAPTVHAQEKTLPDAARPNKKVLLAGFSLLAAAKTLSPRVNCSIAEGTLQADRACAIHALPKIAQRHDAVFADHPCSLPRL